MSAVNHSTVASYRQLDLTAEETTATVNSGASAQNAAQNAAHNAADIARDLDASGATDGIKDANGAPALAPPVTFLASDDVAALLQYLYSASEHSQLETHKNVVTDSANKSRQANESQLEKIKAWVTDSEKASKAGSAGKIIGLVGKIAAFTASSLALAVALGLTPFSAGLTAPLVVLAGIGVTAATLSLIDHGFNKMGSGPEISISNGLTKLSSLILAKFDIPEEKREKIGKTIAGSVGALLIFPVLVEPQLLSTAATGICQLSGAGDVTTSWVAMGVGLTAAIGVGAIMFAAGGGSVSSLMQGADPSKSAATVKALFNASTAGMQALTQVGEGSASIATASYQRNADHKLADKKELEAFIANLSQVMEESREAIKNLVEQIQNSSLLVSKIIQGNNENVLQIIQNQSKQTA